MGSPESAASRVRPDPLLLKACLGGLAGGVILAGSAYGSHQPQLSLGLFLGSILSVLQLLSLRSMTHRVLRAGMGQGPGLFRLYHLIRWVLFALVCWVLLQVSVSCLLGGLAAHLWSLLVLGWVGFRTAMPEKNIAGRGR
jgi:hypothetical protein